MIERENCLSSLKAFRKKSSVYSTKIVHTSKYRVIGVRMPDLKAIAKSTGRITKKF